MHHRDADKPVIHTTEENGQCLREKIYQEAADRIDSLIKYLTSIREEMSISGDLSKIAGPFDMSYIDTNTSTPFHHFGGTIIAGIIDELHRYGRIAQNCVDSRATHFLADQVPHRYIPEEYAAEIVRFLGRESANLIFPGSAVKWIDTPTGRTPEDYYTGSVLSIHGSNVVIGRVIFWKWVQHKQNKKHWYHERIPLNGDQLIVKRIGDCTVVSERDPD